MIRNRFRIAVVLLIIPVMLLTQVACTSQSTIAALVSTLGTATASIAALEGNTALAAKVKADTADAAAAVLAWKSGTPSQMVIEALNIVADDLNLIPYVTPYVALIDIGIATIESIITIVASKSPAPASAVNAKRATVRRQVKLAVKTPKTRNQFVKLWNEAAAANPKLAPLVIQ